jgi:small-conductance mechanosensitive channel
MDGNIIQDLFAQSSEVILRQVLTIALSLFVAWLLQILLRRSLGATQWRLIQIPIVQKFFQVVQRTMWPLLSLILSQLAITFFLDLAWEQTLLVWATFFIKLWLLYSFFAVLLAVNLPPQQTMVLTRKVLLPSVLIIGLLQSLGLLDDVLQWSFTPRRDIKITIGSVSAGLATLAIFFVLARLVRQYLEQIFLPQINVGRALTHALATLTNYALIVVGTIMALSVTGINLTTIAVIAGGLSVGLGFGLQEIASNFVSGFILMFERSIGAGDVLRIDDTVGDIHVGVVQNVGIRSITIRTQDNIELVVPNSKFLTETVTNLTRTEDVMRVRINVGVTYNADPHEVELVLLEAAQHPLVLTEPAPVVQFSDFGDSSLNFSLLVWTDDAARIVALASALRYRIWDLLKAHNIEIPFPQRDLHIRSSLSWADLLKPTNGSQK